MKVIQIFFVSLVAFEHIYFMILEMFFWDKPKGLKAFGQTLEAAKNSKTLDKNEGLYNGFWLPDLFGQSSIKIISSNWLFSF
jgi:putative membrane protein